MFVDPPSTRRWERPLARAANVRLLSERSWENRIIMLRNVALKDSEKVFFVEREPTETYQMSSRWL